MKKTLKAMVMIVITMMMNSDNTTMMAARMITKICIHNITINYVKPIFNTLNIYLFKYYCKLYCF